MWYFRRCMRLYFCCQGPTVHFRPFTSAGPSCSLDAGQIGCVELVALPRCCVAGTSADSNPHIKRPHIVVRPVCLHEGLSGCTTNEDSKARVPIGLIAPEEMVLVLDVESCGVSIGGIRYQRGVVG